MADKSSTKIRWGSASLVALGMAMGLGAGAAYAQNAADTADEEIVVTGFRGSLAAAIDQKREETSAVDVIMAEDIADSPTSTSPNLSSAFRASPSRVRMVKAATFRCGVSVRSSRAFV